MKAAIYARVSTDDQNSANQLPELRKMALARGYEIKEYIDEGISGLKWNRPELNRMMSDAQRGRIKVVICWDISRLGRSVYMIASTVETLRSYGVDFTTVKEQIDTTTPHGKFQFNVFAAFVELERSMIGMRTKEALKLKKSQGIRLGRPAIKLGQSPKMIQGMCDTLSIRKLGEALGISSSSAARLKKTYQKPHAGNQPIIVGEKG